jgi:integrase
MENVLEVYGRELAVVRGVRPATIEAYTKGVKVWLKWLGERSIYEVKREDFLAWREVEAPRRKPAGMQLVVSAVRSFYKWLLETGRIAANPCPAIVIRKAHEEPSVMTTEEFLRLRENVQHDRGKSALIELLAGSGLRIDAALHLRYEQILLSNPSNEPFDWRNRGDPALPLMIPPVRPTDYVMMDPEHSKSRRAVRVPITPCAARALRRFMAPGADPKDLVFRRSYAGAYRMIRDAGQRVGLDISPHSFRHFYACLMCFRTLDGTQRDLIWVRDAMCHSSVQVTDLYLRMARYSVLNEFDWHSVVWHWVPPVDDHRIASVGAAS